MKNVGKITVLGVARNYLRLESDTMKLKVQFACGLAPVSDLGFSMIDI